VAGGVVFAAALRRVTLRHATLFGRALRFSCGFPHEAHRFFEDFVFVSGGHSVEGREAFKKWANVFHAQFALSVLRL
jgi:hypothetical protein